MIGIDANGWVLIIGAIFLGLSNLIPNLLNIYFSHKNAVKAEIAVKENTEITKEIKDAQEVQHIATNSKLSELVDAKVAAASAEGQMKGRADTIAEIDTKTTIKADRDAKIPLVVQIEQPKDEPVPVIATKKGPTS